MILRFQALGLRIQYCKRNIQGRSRSPKQPIRCAKFDCLFKDLRRLVVSSSSFRYSRNVGPQTLHHINDKKCASTFSHPCKGVLTSMSLILGTGLRCHQTTEATCLKVYLSRNHAGLLHWQRVSNHHKHVDPLVRHTRSDPTQTCTQPKRERVMEHTLQEPIEVLGPRGPHRYGHQQQPSRQSLSMNHRRAGANSPVKANMAVLVGPTSKCERTRTHAPEEVHDISVSRSVPQQVSRARACICLRFALRPTTHRHMQPSTRSRSTNESTS